MRRKLLWYVLLLLLVPCLLFFVYDHVGQCLFSYFTLFCDSMCVLPLNMLAPSSSSLITCVCVCVCVVCVCCLQSTLALMVGWLDLQHVRRKMRSHLRRGRLYFVAMAVAIFALYFGNFLFEFKKIITTQVRPARYFLPLLFIVVRCCYTFASAWSFNVISLVH